MFDNDHVGRMEDRTACTLVQMGNETQYTASKRKVSEMDHAQQGSWSVCFQSNGTNGQPILSCKEVRRFELCRENPRRKQIWR